MVGGGTFFRVRNIDFGQNDKTVCLHLIVSKYSG